MQRSHMLLLIQEILVEQHEDMTLEDAANDILTRLERMGVILPPPIWRPKNYGDGHKLTYSEWIQLPSKINEWEPEDV